MKDLHIYWQDAVAMLAGIYLALILGFNISTLTIAEGWIVYVLGCMAAMLTAGGFASKDPNLSWAAAATGVLAILTPLVLGSFGNTFFLVSMIAGGAIVTLLSAWSAVIKKNAGQSDAKAS